MAEYIELGYVADSDGLVELAIDYLEGSIPGFTARPGNVETVLTEANAQMGAEIADQAFQIAPLIFAYFGQSLLGIPPFDAQPARAQATYTFAVDTAAVMVPGGSMIAVPSAGGDAYIFGTDDDITAPAGGGDVLVGITALEEGAAPNGAFGECEPIEVIEGVERIVSTAAGGGVDPETEDAYLDRLASALTILAPRPILPQDFAVMAGQVSGVGRVLALDLYQPGVNDNRPGLPVVGAPLNANAAGAFGVERCVTTAITGESGVAPTATLMQEVYDLLDENREVNFLVYVIAPTYTTIDVSATVMAFPGYLAADVEAQAEQQIAYWLDPNLWGSDPTKATEEPDWAQSTTARVYEAVDYLNRAPGVHYVETVQIGIAGQALGGADIALPGRAPLPQVGTVTVTVHLP